MSKIRKLAKGQLCQIRLMGICNHNPETTVLAHYRLSNACGMGMKPPDYLGAFACSACHDVVDGRIPTDLPREQIRLAHAEGVMRTWGILERSGLMNMN